MSERFLSRLGAAFGIASFIVTFIGFGVHGGLPSDLTAAAIQSYAKRVSAGQGGAGNYMELLGYLFFLGFAAYMYSVARATSPARVQWLNVFGLVAATIYVAVSALAIAAQQLIVESRGFGIDTNTTLAFFVLDDAAFTLSSEIAALFAAALGGVLLAGSGALRVVGAGAIAVGALLFVSGLIGTVFMEISVAQFGLLLLELWAVATGFFLVMKPATISRTPSDAEV